MSFELLQRDEHLIWLNKPTALLCVPGRGADKADCLASRVQRVMPEALVVHRLDRDTSGVVVMARDLDSQRELNRQFEQRRVAKTYIAVVSGVMQEDSGSIDLPVGRDFSQTARHTTDAAWAKPATTLWRVVARHLDTTRVFLTPLTGRSHQLRVHLRAIGHPVVGDPIYGLPLASQRVQRMMLHAAELTVRHPRTDLPITVKAPTPF